MSDGPKAWEALLAAQNSKLDQQLADVQKHVAPNRLSLPEYLYNLSSDFVSVFHEFCRRLLNAARENVGYRQGGINGSFKEAPAPFEQIFQTLQFKLDKKLPNT